MQDIMSAKFTSHGVSMDEIYRQFNQHLNEYINSNAGTVDYSNGYYSILGWLRALQFAGILNSAQIKIFNETLEKAQAFVNEKHRVYERLSSTIEETTPAGKYKVYQNKEEE